MEESNSQHVKEYSSDESTVTHESQNVYECIESLVVDYVESVDAMKTHEYNFDEQLKYEIFRHYNILFENTDFDDFSEFYETHIENIFINNGLVKRSYKSPESLHYYNNVLKINNNIIEFLKNVDQPEQRTKEWYEFRHNHITGSNAWKIFGNPSAQNQLYYEKLTPISIKPSGFSNMNDSPLNWGHKYEQLTIMFYEYYNDVKVSEFGCIPHRSIPFLAASPDGIVTSEKLNGRMVEIKNVVSREITQIPKMEYYIQMQLQMEVCDLDDCDFVETKFVEYDSFCDYIEDKTTNNKGMIIVIMEMGEYPKYLYEYCELFKNNENQMDEYSNEIYKKYKLNKDTLINDEETHKWVKNIYWKLEIYSNVLVQRNTNWFAQAYPQMKAFWDNVLEERKVEDSHLKYKPKSRSKDKTNENKVLNLIKLNDDGTTQENNEASPQKLVDELTEYKDNKVIDLNSFV